MTNEQMPANFEGYASDLKYNTDPDTRPGRSGGYWGSHTDLMWRSWQAATAEATQWRAIADSPKDGSLFLKDKFDNGPNIV